MTELLQAIGALFLNKRGAIKTDNPEPGAAVEEKSKCTILAIDDDQSMLDSLRGTLRDEGYNVLTAQSGPKGLDLLRYANKDVRVVLLDYNMPRFSGLETLPYLRRLSPNVRVVALTGVAPELLPEPYRTGVDKFLAKPFRAAELLGSINEMLRPSQPLVASNS